MNTDEKMETSIVDLGYAKGVLVKREHEKIWSLFEPSTPGYHHWMNVAEGK